MKLRIGIIGLGRIGKIHYNNIMQRLPEAEVTQVAELRRDGLPTDLPFVEIDELIDNPDIDAVIICSPTDTHADFVERCARAGKNVFCEKPLDLSLHRIRQTLQVVQETGIKLMLGFNRRFDPNFLKLRSLVEEGKMGEVQLVKITSRDPGPPPLAYLKSSGGMFLDMTIHDFDMARYMMGKEVVQVYAEAAALLGGEIEEAGDIDTAVVTLKFEDGSMAVIDNSRKAVYGYDQRVEVFGAAGMAKVDNNTPDNHQYFNEEGAQASLPLNFFMDRYTESYLTEMEAFIRACKDDVAVPVAGEDGLQAARIAVAALQSVREGKPIQL
ncbi:inositol 2-dehydrogenase [Sphingobacterium sp. LRF_L2]|uniref:inositol 2-dehydrogenase n=1 Tax=Sphingobacterium sp. LRF_L2 TaxID=3369421 RepID=UPI003F63748E